MFILILGLAIFLGVHSIRLFAETWRSRQIARIGAMPWKALYSVAALGGFALIIVGFGQARLAPVMIWTPPHWTHHLAAALVLLAFVLLVAAFVPGNYIKARTGHPMLAAVKLWALAHFLANGSLADMILFGAFLAWSVAGFAVLRARDRRQGVTYPPAVKGRGLMAVVIALIAFALFAHFGHVWLIGVNPL